MNEFNKTRLQTEKTFVSSALLTEYGIESFDAQYDYLLHDRILSFHQDYLNAGSNPALLDLEEMKTKFSQGAPGEFELYIINKDGVIEYTTNKKDYNLDFSQFPDFFSALTTIRLGNEFRSDPWIRDFQDPHIYEKFGYLPTDDHEYILEIGLRNENYSLTHKALVADLQEITGEALNIPSLTYVELFDKAQRVRTIRPEDNEKNLSEITGFLFPDELGKILNQTFTSKESYTIDNPNKNQVISVQYINLSSTGSVSGAERSYIGILVFTKESIEHTILLYKIGYISVTIISFLVGIFIARYLSGYISRPIEMMTEDVGIIASYTLHHSVRATGILETEKLRVSINRMISSINANIHKIEDQREELRAELILRTKAENALTRVNKRLIQLSQITRHDILNQVTALDLYLEFISDTQNTSLPSDYPAKTQNILRIITQLLHFTCDYEKIGQEGSMWQNIGTILNTTRDEFSGQITIIHSCANLDIFADPLIIKVFYNLIDNTVRHGNTADTIRVSFEEGPDTGCLIYQDNGTGIAEKYKDLIFTSGFGRGSGLGMAFIREVLESDEMYICENGIEGHGARFEITVPRDHYRIIHS